jgi:hypothetical protein
MPSTRPKDKYAAQMIIMFAPDQAIRDNAGMIVRGLNELGWTENGKTTANIFVLEWDHLRLAMAPRDAGAEDKEEFELFKKRLTESDGAGRIYLSGHGDWASQTLAGRKAEWVAEALKAHCPPVKLISVIGCGLGRDLGSNETLISSSMNSFGSLLHGHLKGFCDELVARVLDISIDFGPRSRGQKGTGTFNPETRKVTDSMHHRAASKLRFVWKGGRQVREWVLYDAVAGVLGTDDDLDRLFLSL